MVADISSKEETRYYSIMTLIIINLAAAAVFGLFLGSFLTVIIERLPKHKLPFISLFSCPSCETSFGILGSIPVIGFFILNGKCRLCSKKISPIRPVIEVLTALITAGLFFMHGPTIKFLADLCLSAVLIASAVIDLQYMIIPNRLTLFGGICGIILSFFGEIGSLFKSVLGAFSGFVILITLFFMGKVFYKRDGVGMGDVKLAIVMGLFLGPFWCIIAMFLAIFIGGTWGIIQMTFRKRIALKEIPFGPFMALGGMLVLFFRPQILSLVERYISTL